MQSAPRRVSTKQPRFRAPIEKSARTKGPLMSGPPPNPFVDSDGPESPFGIPDKDQGFDPTNFRANVFGKSDENDGY